MKLFKKKASMSTPPVRTKTLVFKALTNSPKYDRPSEFIKAHTEYENLYAQTIAGSIIDTEVNSTMAGGYTLRSDIDGLAEKVRAKMEEMDVEYAIRQMVRNARVHGFGICEKAMTYDGRRILKSITPLTLKPVESTLGNIIRFDQYNTQGQVVATLEENDCIWFALNPSDVDIGISEIARNIVQIKNHENVSKANVEMIWRMGFPAYEVKIGGDLPPADVPGKMESVIPDLSPGSNITTGMGTVINELNKGGIPQIQTYADWTLQELAVGFQVMRSMVGLLDNAEATAKVTREMYNERIDAEKDVIASIVQREIIDVLILPLLNQIPGAVKFEFNPTDSEARLKKAQFVDLISKLDTMDPYSVMSKDEIKEYLGFEVKEDAL